MHREDYEGAIAAFTEAIQLASHLSAYHNRAEAYRKLGRLEEAEADEQAWHAHTEAAERRAAERLEQEIAAQASSKGDGGIAQRATAFLRTLVKRG